MVNSWLAAHYRGNEGTRAASRLSLSRAPTELNGIEVVLQTLGVSVGDLFRPVTLFSHATRVLVNAMESRGVKRLICVTGFGAGDSYASISFLQLVPFRLVFGRAYDDKSVQERLIKQSSLDWTIVRPGVPNQRASDGAVQSPR